MVGAILSVNLTARQRELLKDFEATFEGEHGARGDAEAAVVNGLDVGPEELESNGTGHITAFPGGRHVGENK